VCKLFSDSKWAVIVYHTLLAATIPRPQESLQYQTGNLGDEQHLLVVFECPPLQGVRDRYNGLFMDHADTMI